MKIWFLLPFVFLFVLSSPALAADAQYQASLTGVECNGCKKTISQAIGRLQGVKTIRISKTGEKTHRMTVVTDGTKALTKSDVVKAMGKDAPHYQIASWTRVN